MSPAAALLRRLDAEATGGPWRRVDNRNNHWGMRDVEGPGVGGHLLVGFTIATDVDAAQRVRIEGDAKCIATTRNLLPLLAGLVEACGAYIDAEAEGTFFDMEAAYHALNTAAAKEVR